MWFSITNNPQNANQYAISLPYQNLVFKNDNFKKHETSMKILKVHYNNFFKYFINLRLMVI